VAPARGPRASGGQMELVGGENKQAFGQAAARDWGPQLTGLIRRTGEIFFRPPHLCQAAHVSLVLVWPSPASGKLAASSTGKLPKKSSKRRARFLRRFRRAALNFGLIRRRNLTTNAPHLNGPGERRRPSDGKMGEWSASGQIMQCHSRALKQSTRSELATHVSLSTWAEKLNLLAAAALWQAPLARPTGAHWHPLAPIGKAHWQGPLASFLGKPHWRAPRAAAHLAASAARGSQHGPQLESKRAPKRAIQFADAPWKLN